MSTPVRSRRATARIRRTEPAHAKTRDLVSTPSIVDSEDLDRIATTRSATRKVRKFRQLVIVDESAKEIAAADANGRVQRRWVGAVRCSRAAYEGSDLTVEDVH